MKAYLLAIALAATLFATPAASADEPGCERVPIFGLNPQVREICDGPIQPGGWWSRARRFSHPEFVHSTCGDWEVHTHAGFFCPTWAPRDTIPAYQGPIETYIVTDDTIPPGEPGHLG